MEINSVERDESLIECCLGCHLAGDRAVTVLDSRLASSGVEGERCERSVCDKIEQAGLR